ncbi:MAG: HAMP domain-containing sensor histidine kinase [Dermatophilus congolensis]|nr:HAMP domain-containing sensor histidine kinase [Dermatophilus congolensis]
MTSTDGGSTPTGTTLPPDVYPCGAPLTPTDVTPGAKIPRGRFSGWPLRRRLVMAVVLLVVAITMATGVITTLALQRSLEDSLDEKVLDTATRAIRPLRDGRGDRFEDGLPRGLGGDFLLLVVSGSTAVTNTVFTHDGDATALNAQQVQALLDTGLTANPTTIDLGGKLGSYRLVATRTQGVTLISGLPTAEMEHTVREVRLLTASLTGAGLIVIAVATTIIVRRSMRPLERVAGIATRVSTLPLSTGDGAVAERVPWADTDRRTEVGQVGAAVNDLLDHIDTTLRARAASEAKLRHFVADASHELRTPLASIRGYAELTRREPAPVPEGVRHALDRVQSEAERMTTLVEELLMLARLDTGRESVREKVDLTRIVLDATGDAHAAGPDHVWQLDLPEEAVEIDGDPAQLTQVVVNLLGNARTHTPAGTTVVTRLAAGSVPGTVTVEVSDNGPGIPPEFRAILFDRFSQADTSRTGGSTGLGLSIVQAVVRAHGGTVEVASRHASELGDASAGGGATGSAFRVTLPV